MAKHTPEEIAALRAKAAEYGESDPGAGIEWIVKTLPSPDAALEEVYGALIEAMLKKDPEAAISIAATVPNGGQSLAFGSALYSVLARNEPGTAWAVLKENRIAANPVLAVRAITSAEVDSKGLEAALADYRANRPGSSISFFFTVFASNKGLSRADVTVAMRELDGLESDQGYSNALANVIRNASPANHDVITSHLGNRSSAPKYDQPYQATSLLLLDSGDPVSAAMWAGRITNPELKADTAQEIRASLSTVDQGTRGKVEELLKK